VESAYRSLLIPAILSAISFATTIYVFDRWEKAEAFEEDDSNEAGYLKDSRNGIERRHKSRLLWQEVNSGSKIYFGDAVRTPPRAEGNVQLVQGDTIITLEPNSLIVLEKKQGQLELNLLSGSLLVDSKSGQKKGSDPNAKGPIIRAGKTQVEVGKGTQLSLSKAQGSEANIAVVKGEAAVQSGGKEFKVNEGKTGVISGDELQTESNIEVLSPASGAIVVLNNLKDRRLGFSFKPIAADLRVSLEAGPNRSELKDTGVSVSGSIGKMAMAVPAEVFYWRFVARDGTGRVVTASVPMRAEGVFAAAPELFSPESNAVITPGAGEQRLTFNWSKVPKAASLRLQVSTDSRFSSTVINRDFSDATEFSTTLPKDGTYYWRVSAVFPGVSAPVASESRRFQVAKKIELAPPRLASPKSDARLMAADIKQGVFFEWTESPGATGYEVMVTPKGGKPLREVVASGPYRLNQTKTGEYRWAVRATRGDDASKWAAARTFTIEKAADLRWNVTETTQLYPGDKPTAEVRWQKPPASVAKLRLRFARQGAAMAGATAKDVTGTAVKVQVAGDGAYEFELEGLSNGGDVVAVSRPITITVKQRPELDPPVLISSSGTGPIKASSGGDAKLRWKPVAGAKSYVITLKHVPTGKVRELKSRKTDVDLAELDPGEYEVTLRSIDQSAKPGPNGKPKALVVPAVSNVAPPDSLEIKVH
jgi:hypothetical protein